MHNILVQLENDHQRIVRMLYILDKEIAMLVGTRSGKADYDTILDVLDYIHVYPKFWHHPTEHIILNTFSEVSFSTTELPDNIDDLYLATIKLRDEHAKLDAMSEELAAIFSDMRLSGEMGKVKINFQRIFKLFFEREMSHIRHEREIFNVIDKCFTSTHWSWVEEKVTETVDAELSADKDFYVKRSNELCQLSAVTASMPSVSGFENLI